MNKLLSIIVLVMLLSGCSTTPVEVKNYKTECIEGDCINGQGTYTFSSGNKYVGEFKNGKRHGKGTFTQSDGYKYIGDWKNGNRDGIGVVLSKKHKDYKSYGQYVDNDKNGWGYFSLKDKITCSGEYKNDEYNSNFLCTRSDGFVAVATLINGKLEFAKSKDNEVIFVYPNPKPRLYYDQLTGGMRECAHSQALTTGNCVAFKPFNNNLYDKDTLFYNPSTGAMQNCAGVVSVNGKCSAYGIFNHSKATADKGQLYYDAKNKKMTTCLFVDLNGVCKHYELVPNSWANNYGGFRMTDPNNPYLKRIPQTSQDFIDLGMRMLSGGCTLGLDC